MTKLEHHNALWSIGMYVVGMLILWLGLLLGNSHQIAYWLSLFVGGINVLCGILTKGRPSDVG